MRSSIWRSVLPREDPLVEYDLYRNPEDEESGDKTRLAVLGPTRWLLSLDGEGNAGEGEPVGRRVCDCATGISTRRGPAAFLARLAAKYPLAAPVVDADFPRLATATASVLMMQPARRRVWFASAGHPPYFVVSERHVRIGPCDGTGPLLGSGGVATYALQRGSWNPGEALVQVSDTLLDCRRRGGAFFDPESFADLLRDLARDLCRGQIEGLAPRLAAAAGESDLCGDITSVVVRHRSPVHGRKAALTKLRLPQPTLGAQPPHPWATANADESAQSGT